MRRVAAVAVAVVLVGAGCSGDDEAAGPTTTAATAATVATTSTTTTTIDPEYSTEWTTVIAHRGASAYAPEHTFAAYDLALEQGADYLEQDLQMTADGELVVLHDPTLDRTARGAADSCTGAVATKTLAQLKTCDAGSWYNEAHPDRADPSFAALRIPTLREVLERYAGRAQFYIETKSPEAQPGMEQALLDVLDEVGPPPAPAGTPIRDQRPVVIQSFSAESLQLVRTLSPARSYPLVLLLPASATPLDPAVLDGTETWASGVGPAAANVDAAFVEAAHAHCLDVHPYTVDDPAEMARLIEAGVDGMFTNAPDVLRPLVVELPEVLDVCG